MRKKLNTFTQFAQALYPHELEYLLSVQNFEKEENIKILKQIYHNATSADHKEYNPNKDKRTYSYLKNWITQSLEKIDVDLFFQWLVETETKVLTDLIAPEDESRLLSVIKKLEPTDYNFIRFYELVQYYRDYLMVRNRKKNIETVIGFLNSNKEHYHKLKNINLKLDELTEQIVEEKVFNPAESKAFEEYLKKIYFNNSFDGYTRYRAVVRLTIFYYNSRQFDAQHQVYLHLDELLKTPLFYSKRILANYYANRAMMHQKRNELQKAERFAYLSIQNKNSDYLFYLINLCGVLLKEGKKTEALNLMRQSIPELKNTSNNYYKIGFASYYIRTMIYNGMQQKAVDYASQYFDAYRKEIFEYRWHLFMREYIHALIAAEKYARVLALCKRYKLISKEKLRMERIDYLPIIQAYYYLAEYMENNISQEKLISSISKTAHTAMGGKYQLQRINELLDELAPLIPTAIKTIRLKLKVQ